MTIEARIEQARQRFGAALNVEEPGEYREAFEEFADVLEAQRVGRLRAITRGLSKAGLHLSALETETVELEAHLAVDHLDGIEGADEETKLAFLERLTELLAQEPLRVKVLSALLAEERMTDRVAVSDGILGRKVNEALATMAPYMQSA